jgi:hypothetical protein
MGSSSSKRKEKDKQYDLLMKNKNFNLTIFINECLEKGFEIKKYNELLEMSKEKIDFEKIKELLTKYNDFINNDKNRFLILLCCNNFKDAAKLLMSKYLCHPYVYGLIIENLLENKNIKMFLFVSEECISFVKILRDCTLKYTLCFKFMKLCINGKLDEIKLLSTTFDLTSCDIKSVEPNIGVFLCDIKNHQDVLNWLIYDFKITTNENLINKFGNKDFQLSIHEPINE